MHDEVCEQKYSRKMQIQNGVVFHRKLAVLRSLYQHYFTDNDSSITVDERKQTKWYHTIISQFAATRCQHNFSSPR